MSPLDFTCLSFLYQTHVRLHLIVHNFIFRHMHHTADLFWSQFVCPLMYVFIHCGCYVCNRCLLMYNPLCTWTCLLFILLSFHLLYPTHTQIPLTTCLNPHLSPTNIHIQTTQHITHLYITHTHARTHAYTHTCTYAHHSHTPTCVYMYYTHTHNHTIQHQHVYVLHAHTQPHYPT